MAELYGSKPKYTQDNVENEHNLSIDWSVQDHDQSTTKESIPGKYL